jgi:TetR/AcrR family transcriptional regulator
MGIQERKEREKENRKQQILEAGEKLFIQKGLQSTTMDEIANVCELSKGTLYLYYKSKEELFFSIINRACDVFIDILKSNIEKSRNYEEKIGSLGRSYLQLYKRHPHCFKLMNHFDEHNYGEIESNFGKRSNSCDFEMDLSFKTQEIWKLVVDVIQEGIEVGYLKKDVNPHELAIIFWTTSNGIIQIWDHMTMYHNFTMNNKEKKNYEHLIEFSKIDYEKMLIKVWDIIGNTITATP